MADKKLVDLELQVLYSPCYRTKILALLVRKYLLSLAENEGAFKQKSIADPVLRAFALTNLARDPKAGGRMRWKIGIDNLWRNMGIIGGFDLGQGLQAPASQLGLSFKRDAFFVQGGKSRFIRQVSRTLANWRSVCVLY